MEARFVYVHKDPEVRQAQLQQRKSMLSAAAEGEFTDTVVIEVLLALLRHQGSEAAAVREPSQQPEVPSLH